MSDSSDNSDNEKIRDGMLTKDNLSEEMESKGIYQENKSVVLSRKIRIFILILFLLLSIVTDLDGGIFSSSIDTVQKDLGMTKDEYGVFTSASYFGRIIGAFIFMIVISFKHRKFTLILTIILHGSAFLVYRITINKYILIFVKIFITTNKVCGSVYRPVWVEQFGLSNYKSSILLSLVQIVSSFGNSIGFVLGQHVFGEESWRNALTTVAILMGSIAFGFIICPGKYFYRSYMLYNDKIVDTEDSDNTDDSNNMTELSSVKIKKGKGSIFINYRKNEKKKKNKLEDVLKYLVGFLKDIIFILVIIKRANTTFVLQIIHTYIKSYQVESFGDKNDTLNYINNSNSSGFLDEDLNVTNKTAFFGYLNEDLYNFNQVERNDTNKDNSNEELKKLISYFYLFSSLVCGSFGGLLGGIITKKIGGVESKNSIYILFFSELIVSINIGFLAFSGNFYIYNINLMAFFFFSLMGAPIIQGYLIKTLPESKKSVGIGVDMIVSTCLGKIISTIIYGAIEEKYKDLAWKICIGYYYVGTLISLILCYVKIHHEIKTGTSDAHLENHIINSIALGAGSDFNDEFRLQMPVPKKSICKYVDNINYKLPSLDSV